MGNVFVSRNAFVYSASKHWSYTFVWKLWWPHLPWNMSCDDAPQCGASGENTELKRSPFKAWSSSVYSYTCHAYCQGFFPCLFLPFLSIHQHFFQNLSRFHQHFFQNLSWFLLCWLWLTHGSCVGSRNKIRHPVGCGFLCWVPTEYKYTKRTWLVVWCFVQWISWSLCSALM